MLVLLYGCGFSCKYSVCPDRESYNDRNLDLLRNSDSNWNRPFHLSFDYRSSHASKYFKYQTNTLDLCMLSITSHSTQLQRNILLYPI